MAVGLRAFIVPRCTYLHRIILHRAKRQLDPAFIGTEEACRFVVRGTASGRIRTRPRCDCTPSWFKRSASAFCLPTLLCLFCLPRSRLTSSYRFCYGKVVELRACFQFFAEPTRLCSSSCPRIACPVSVFDRHLTAPHGASPTSSIADPATQLRELRLQLFRPLIKNSTDVFAQL